MAFTPFTKDDLPTMAAFNEKLQAIFDDAESKAKIEVGSYVGTGTYGSMNKTSLTFGFVPKFVLIRCVKQSRGAALLIQGVKDSYIYWGYTNGSDYSQIVCTWNEKELSFYANDNSCYCNTKSDKYLYIAIG